MVLKSSENPYGFVSSLYFGGDFLSLCFQFFEDNLAPPGRIRSKLGQMILTGLPEVFEHHIPCKNSRGGEKTISYYLVLYRAIYSTV